MKYTTEIAGKYLMYLMNIVTSEGERYLSRVHVTISTKVNDFGCRNKMLFWNPTGLE